MATESGLPKIEGLERAFQSDPEPVSTDKDAQTQPSVPDVTVQQQEQTPPTTDGQVITDKDLAGILKTFTTPDGKIRTKDLLHSYKEIVAGFTRVSQDNSQLKKDLQKLADESELRSYQSPQPQYQPTQQKTFEQMFVENPEQAIEYKAAQIANTQRISEVLEEKESENPAEFQERFAYVRMLSQNPQYSPLSNTPKGVRKLFEIADKTRKETLVKRGHEFVKTLFGEDVDLEKFKALVTKDQQPNTNNPPANPLNAYMPNTGTSTRTGADTNIQVDELERAKQEAIKSGDANKVAGVLLKQALLK